MTSSSRLAPPEPGWALGAPADDDQTAWLVTFSDLVLQLFAFVLVAMVLGNGRRGVEQPPVAAPAVAVARDEDAPRRIVAEPLAARVRTEEPAEEMPAEVRDPEPPPAAEPAIAGPPAPPAPDDSTPDRIAALEQELRTLARVAGHDDAIGVRVGAGDVVVTLNDIITFPSGRAELLPAAVPMLAAIRALAVSLPDFAVYVEGHTDDMRIQTAAFPSNLELSLARAARVARELTAGDGALLARTVASGFGEHRPVVSNYDPAGRARNRRVEIRLVQQAPATG